MDRKSVTEKKMTYCILEGNFLLQHYYSLYFYNRHFLYSFLTRHESLYWIPKAVVIKHMQNNAK